MEKQTAQIFDLLLVALYKVDRGYKINEVGKVLVQDTRSPHFCVSKWRVNSLYFYINKNIIIILLLYRNTI